LKKALNAEICGKKDDVVYYKTKMKKVNNANFCSESSSSIHFPALPPILFSHLVLDPNPAFARYFFRKDPVSSSFQNLISVLKEPVFPKSFLENFSCSALR
jgi:hypothetical protein